MNERQSMPSNRHTDGELVYGGGQNTSSAVMQQRIEPRDSLEDFPTPPWATRALVRHVIWLNTSDPLRGQLVWEPACNRGHMARALGEYFQFVHSSDIHDYGWAGQDQVVDFLLPNSEPDLVADHGVDWIITNPPFRLAQEFVARSFELQPRVGIAIIVRTAFLEGKGRYENLFSKNPPSIVAQFTERVVMVKGRLEPKGSTATAYCWLVWLRDGAPRDGPLLTWVPPCRRRLEREEDYRDFGVLA